VNTIRRPANGDKILAVAQPIGTEGQQRWLQALLRYHGQGMGGMVLHLLQHQRRHHHRHTNLVGEIKRVSIDRDPLQLVAIAIPQFGDAGAETFKTAPLG
jgi:hypothetical protein